MLKNHPGLDSAFHALADPVRRGMLARLSRGPATVSELAEPLPISLPAVLQHLKTLETSGLVRSRKSGRVRTVTMEPLALGRAEEWLAERRRELEAQIDRLENYVAKLKSGGDQ